MADTVTIDAFADELAATLATYTDEVEQAISGAITETATETRDMLRKTSPEMTGKYAKSWRVTKLYPWLSVVNAGGKHYRLVHLLEKGHAKRGGGRVQAYPHVAVAEDFAGQQLENRIADAINGVG